MFKCRDISLKASEYLEKQLPAGQHLGYAFHLLMCGRCRAFVKHLEKAVTAFQGLPPKEMDEMEAKKLGEIITKRAGENRDSSI